MSNLKKVLALVLVLALSLTMFAGAIETVLPYDDVDELTAEQLDALQLLYALGVIKGDDENSVNPTDTLTRGELCAILYRLYTGDAEEKYVSTYSTDCPYFDDVEDGKWYVPYVNWAYIKGVVAGYGNGKFGPTDNVDGVQAATMLARLVGYEIGSENWELVARKHAIELGLDDGVSSKDLFGTDLSRGDMIVMVANVLDCYEVGTKVTLAEKIFDLEIIRGAILLGADKLGSTDYSVFAFKDEISGNVKYFITDLLSIEEKPTVDEIGQKYTLYVAKNTEKNGYKILYAAYEEAENAYYKTVTGTVDDGKLNVTDATKKETYLLNLLDDHVIAYINGEVVANNASDAFAAFKASYGLKNSAAYKLIDNDGDGKYEYIFIERLTLANMKTTEVVANVVSYNNITGAYTLSDGKEYVPGQYWGYDADAKKITGVVNAVDAIVAAVGTGTSTVSSVQYKFTIENGKYLMKAEICDETYFAGNYVLSMGIVGTSTYKGMQYVQFLTEDNTSLYAYVSKINHRDVRTTANWNDNNPWTAFNYLYELFYINAYGDDTVEVFTPNYINSNYVNDFVDGAKESVVTVDMTSKFDAADAVDNVYTRIDAVVSEKGGIVPSIPFDANKYYYLYNETTGKYDAVIFTESTYIGYFAKLAANQTANLKALEKAVADAENALIAAEKAVDDKKVELENAKKLLDKLVAEREAILAIAEAERTEEQKAKLIELNDQIGTTARPDVETNIPEAIAAAEEAVTTAQGNVTKAKEDLAKAQAGAIVGSDVYYVSAFAKPAKEVAVSIAVDYNTDELQIFKAYGSWYVQNYGDLTNDGYTVYFKVDGATYEVEYIDGAWYAIFREGDKVTKTLFSVGAANAETINNSIQAVIDGFATDEDFVYDKAQALNTSKGVVFAYGSYPYNITAGGPAYTWRAYNFDEFNVASFGNGGKSDDWFVVDGNADTRVLDEMVYTISNGQYYVKAAKVTVAKGKNDVLPMGWMVENSKVFVYGKELGTITTSGITVQSILPNGAFESIFVPFGYNFSYGDIIYAVKGEDGSFISYEKISNIYDVLKDNDGNKYQMLADDKSSFKGYAADGTVTIQGKLGITYTVKIDIAKTFFANANDNKAEFITSDAFAKLVKEGAKFVIYTDANGYYYAFIDAATK